MAKRVAGGLVWAVVLLVVTAITASAQNATAKNSGDHLVGLVVSSNYARIADFLPRLTERLAKTLPKKDKQVRILPIDSSVSDPEQTCRDKGCDYLLMLNVAEITGVGVGFDTRPNSFADKDNGDERERRELDWVRIEYRVLSVKNDDVDVSDTDHVRYGEKPTGWDAMAYETTVSRAVTRVAGAALSKIPKN